MQKNKISIIITLTLIALLFMASCEKETESNITVVAEIPVSVKLGYNDTLKFQISSDKSLLRIDLRKDTLIFARFKEDVIGKKSKQFNFNFIFTPAAVGKISMELFVINDNFDTKTYPFSIEVTE